MEQNINNRQARGRGRPTKAEVESRPAPVEAVTNVPVPVGTICPCCGRGMVPKVLRVEASKRTLLCTLCARRFKMFLPDGGKRWLVQPL